MLMDREVLKMEYFPYFFSLVALIVSIINLLIRAVDLKPKAITVLKIYDKDFGQPHHPIIHRINGIYKHHLKNLNYKVSPKFVYLKLTNIGKPYIFHLEVFVYLKVVTIDIFENVLVKGDNFKDRCELLEIIKPDETHHILLGDISNIPTGKIKWKVYINRKRKISRKILISRGKYKFNNEDSIKNSKIVLQKKKQIKSKAGIVRNKKFKRGEYWRKKQIEKNEQMQTSSLQNF